MYAYFVRLACCVHLTGEQSTVEVGTATIRLGGWTIDCRGITSTSRCMYAMQCKINLNAHACMYAWMYPCKRLISSESGTVICAINSCVHKLATLPPLRMQVLNFFPNTYTYMNTEESSVSTNHNRTQPNRTKNSEQVKYIGYCQY